MGINFKLDRENMQRMLGSTVAARQAVDDFACNFLREQAILVQNSATKKTPVATGHLKASWHMDSVKTSGKKMSIDVYNDAEYAFYVEHGHRRSNHKPPPIAGRHMGRDAMAEQEPYIAERLKAKSERFLRKHLGGGSA
ncbi:MAG: HK97 gp10 family phage protein [Clostridium sp.]|jgi:hypothetical protein|nr:HK97 gp10 family phage protein [Clostridium sp.]